MVKAHAIRIKAKLPEDLWPEIVWTAGYLANRSPSKSLNWITPYEKLHSCYDQGGSGWILILAVPQPRDKTDRSG